MIDMVKKTISKTKSGKAAGPSGVMVEMIRAAGDTGATMIRDLAIAIIEDGKTPADCEQSLIINVFIRTRIDVYETLCPQQMLVHKVSKIKNWGGECRYVTPKNRCLKISG